MAGKRHQSDLSSLNQHWRSVWQQQDRRHQAARTTTKDSSLRRLSGVTSGRAACSSVLLQAGRLGGTLFDRREPNSGTDARMCITTCLLAPTAIVTTGVQPQIAHLTWRRSCCASSIDLRKKQCSCTPLMPKVAFTAPTCGRRGRGGRQLCYQGMLGLVNAVPASRPHHCLISCWQEVAKSPAALPRSPHRAQQDVVGQVEGVVLLAVLPVHAARAAACAHLPGRGGGHRGWL